MSMNRICPICGTVEEVRINFGNNNEAEVKFHDEKWCDCGFKSKEEYLASIDIYVDVNEYEKYRKIINSHNDYLHRLLNTEARKHVETDYDKFMMLNDHHVKHTLYGNTDDQVREVLWGVKSQEIWRLWITNLISDRKQTKWDNMKPSKKKWFLYDKLILNNYG